jgi:CBS domain-containing protein
MKVRDLMTRGVITVGPNDTVAAARKRFRERDIHHLLVVDAGVVCGVVTHRELAGRSEAEAIRNVMLREVVAVDPDTTLRKAATLMIAGAGGCLPVMEGTKLAGIITTSDLRRAVKNTEDTLR